jgi:hypothetical protein
MINVESDANVIPTGAFHITPSGVVSPRDTWHLCAQPDIRPEDYVVSSSSRNLDEEQALPQVLEEGTYQNRIENLVTVGGAAEPEQRRYLPSANHLALARPSHVAREETHDAIMESIGQEFHGKEGKRSKSCFSTRRFGTTLLCILVVGVSAFVTFHFLNEDEETIPVLASTSAPTVDGKVFRVRDFLEDFVSSPESFSDISSPQSAALSWVADDPSSKMDSESISAGGPEYEKLLTRYSLAVFYFGLDGNSWFSNEGWLSTQDDECSWEYISCDGEGSVISIDSSGSPRNIRGQIPSEIQHISSLREYTTAFLNA